MIIYSVLRLEPHNKSKTLNNLKVLILNLVINHHEDKFLFTVPDKTSIDYNRAGVALMEIASYPDLSDWAESEILTIYLIYIYGYTKLHLHDIESHKDTSCLSFFYIFLFLQHKY